MVAKKAAKAAIFNGSDGLIEEFAGETGFFGLQLLAQCIQAVGQAIDVAGVQIGLFARTLCRLDDADQQFATDGIDTLVQLFKGATVFVLVEDILFVLLAGIVGGGAAGLLIQGREAAVTLYGIAGRVRGCRWYGSDSHCFLCPT